VSTPFEAPETEAAPATSPTYGTTRFTEAMMRSLRAIRVFHLLFGVIALGFGFLSLVCSGTMALPLAIAPSGPAMSPSLLGGIIALYVVMGLAYVAIAFWLLLGGYHMQLASWSEDATWAVEKALRDVVWLWVTITLLFVGTLLAYGGFMALIFTSMPGPPAP